MATNRNFPENDPRHHTANVKDMLDELVKHLREDQKKFDDPGARTLFLKAAGALSGLWSAFDDYEKDAEEGLARGATPRHSRGAAGQ